MEPNVHSPEKPQLEVVLAEINTLIDIYSKSKTRDRRLSFLLKMTTVAFAATITVLLGLEGTYINKILLKDIALILGALTTVFSAFEAFFGLRGLWIRAAVTRSHLYELKRDMLFYKSGIQGNTYDEQTIMEFKDRLNRIMQNDLQVWLKLRDGTPILPESGTQTKTQPSP
jgi:hypothetical protein